MNCEKFLTRAADLARNQIMDASELTSARVHVDECDDCRRAHNDQLELSDRLRQFADQTTSARAPEHVEAQLRAAFRDRTSVVSIHSRSQRWRYWLSAAAAVVLTVSGLLAWRSHVASRQRPEGQRQVQASSKIATAPSSESSQSQSIAFTGVPSLTRPLIKPLARKSPSRPHPAAPQLAKTDAARQPTVEQAPVLANKAQAKELATDFVLVGYGNALDLQDGGQLVRVELPRSALATFGLPMNMNRADERIKADVLVGTDGLARAIRFVEVKALDKK